MLLTDGAIVINLLAPENDEGRRGKDGHMRGTILSSLVVALLLAGPAHAAPTCQTLDGVTIRCGTEGAMPVGWRIPPEQRRADPLGGNGAALLKVGLGLALLLAFIALLPPFDGSKDWDRQESDD